MADPELAARRRVGRRRVGRRFVALYTLAYLGCSLLFLAPLLVSLALKVNSLVGVDRAPNNLSLVAGVGSVVALIGNPLVGRLSDRTVSPLGMRRPWMVIGLVGGTLGIVVVATAPNVRVSKRTRTRRRCAASLPGSSTSRRSPTRMLPPTR